jgi:hypothetical protein
LNLLPYISNSKKYRFAPYVFGGVAVFHFNPKAELNGTSYALQPLHTEDPERYGLIQPAFPYGVGIKYSLGNFWNLSLEVGQRKLLTDYLDDVSDHYASNPDNLSDIGEQLSNRTPEVDPSKTTYPTNESRGDPKDKDMYIFAGFTISKTIRRFSCTNF